MKLKSRSSLFYIAVFAVSLLATLIYEPVAAQQSTGLTVTPGVINASISREATTQQTKVTIRNNYDAPVRLSAELKSIDETTARLIPGGELSSELRSVLSLSETDITLPARSDKTIVLQTVFTDLLKPGGHYATLVLTEQSISGSSLSLRSAVSVTIFLTNREGVKESFELKNFDTKSTLFSLPRKATVSVINNGNVHSVPRGVVKLRASNGVVLAQGILNSGSNPVLPGKQFDTSVPLSQVKTSFWPQKIQVVLQYRGDQSTTETEVLKTVWYVPVSFIGYLILGLAILAGILRFALPDLRKRLRRRMSQKANSKRRKVRQQPVHIQDVVKVDKKQR